MRILVMERAREQALLQAFIGNLTRPPASYPTEDEIKGFYEASKVSWTPSNAPLSQIHLFTA